MLFIDLDVTQSFSTTNFNERTQVPQARNLRLTGRQVHGFCPADDPERKPWHPGSPIPYAGRVFTDEVEAAVSSTLISATMGSEGVAMESSLFSRSSTFTFG